MKYGFLKAAAARPNLVNGAPEHNVKEILEAAGAAADEGAELIIFPELTLTSCAPGDLVLSEDFLYEALNALSAVQKASEGLDALLALGLPFKHRDRIYSVTAALFKGKILALIPKTKVSPEDRFIAAAPREFYDTAEVFGEQLLLTPNVIICEKATGMSLAFECGAEYSDPPPVSVYHCAAGANVIASPAARAEKAGGADKTAARLKYTSALNRAAFIYADIAGNHPRASLSGLCTIVEAGEILTECRPYAEEKKFIITDIDCAYLNALRAKKPLRGISAEYEKIFITFPERPQKYHRALSPLPFADALACYTDEVGRIIADCVYRRFTALNCDSFLIGVSGGADSAAALLLLYNACVTHGADVKKITAVTMPSLPTSARTAGNAAALIKKLGVAHIEISIENALAERLTKLGHDGRQDVTYQNIQARTRMQILLDLGNRDNGLVIGTADMSELALGWATYGGDHISHFNLLGNLTKTQIRAYLASEAKKTPDRALASVLTDILATPSTPELKDNQLTEEEIGSYELIDFFIFHRLYRGACLEKTAHLAARAFPNLKKPYIEKSVRAMEKRILQNSFKRNAAPDAPVIQDFNISEVYLPSV